MTTRPPHHWDVARAAKTMAVRTTIQIDPANITVRIRNKLTKWLTTGYLDGGWSSQARRLGEMLANKYNLPANFRTWQGIDLHDDMPEACRLEVRELIVADWTATCVEHPLQANSWYRQRFDETIRDIDAGKKTRLWIHDSGFGKLIIASITKHLTPEHRARAQVAIDALNGTELITIYNYEA